MQPTLEQVVAWSTEAAAIALNMQTENLETHYKAANELVTAADSAVEAFLIEKIQAHFPDHSINAEESGEHDRDSDHKWYIDPIDGTLNYSHRLPIWAVSVAYAYKGELQIGVICNPAMKETFWAARGQGAFLNGEPISVSKTDILNDSLLITGFRRNTIATPRSNIRNFTRLSLETQTIRRLGSAASDLAYVACGRAEGFWEIDLNPWDVAAGVLIVREAGGIVDSLYGDGELLTGKVNILSANPLIFPQMRKILLEERDNS
ncbi:MAG: inositol monophosphatase family protein [Anaerolineaceae bacterium]|jgi:myo-inositol-1(or 4)-monophosphatase|nr:inositol monophosphatase family protein [Anaerolineaceae bacterium]MDD4042729.1 inositol monophosphatase family protein [Anaerolineaceae bacterium]MDD4577062.1 inositol monophosphatase family protein [Anaerolineaceae bacterium]